MAADSFCDSVEIRQFGLISLFTITGSLLAWLVQPSIPYLHSALPPAKVVAEVTRDSAGRRFGTVVAENGPWAPRNVVINHADHQALQAIPGIGTSTADAILRERQRGGSFADWADFERRVPGIGATRVAELQRLGVQLQASDSTAP